MARIRAITLLVSVAILVSIGFFLICWNSYIADFPMFMSKFVYFYNPKYESRIIRGPWQGDKYGEVTRDCSLEYPVHSVRFKERKDPHTGEIDCIRSEVVGKKNDLRVRQANRTLTTMLFPLGTIAVLGIAFVTFRSHPKRRALTQNGVGILVDGEDEEGAT